VAPEMWLANLDVPMTQLPALKPKPSSASPSDFVPLVESGNEPERRRRATRKANIGIPPLNITSFLDMSFCLLTFLILSASFALGEGVLTSNLPGDGSSAVVVPTETPPTSDAPQFVVFVAAVDRTNCRIEVENYPDKPASFTALTQMLQRLGANAKGETDPDARVIIQAEAGVRWDHVLNAFNAAVRARFKNIAFTEPK
jgi:biopolymer transport protein ExbD